MKLKEALMKVNPERAHQLPIEEKDKDLEPLIDDPILLQYASVAKLIKEGIVSPIPYETLMNMPVEQVLIWVQVSGLEVLSASKEVI